MVYFQRCLLLCSWLPRETATVMEHVLCMPYIMQPHHHQFTVLFEATHVFCFNLPPTTCVRTMVYGSQCLGFFTCAHTYCVGACDCCTRGSMNIVRESALKANSERKNLLLHWGLESASVLRLAFRFPVQQDIFLPE